MPETKTQQVEEALEEGKDKITGNGDGNGSIGRKVLIPAAAGLGTLAATYAVRKAPDLLRDHAKPKLEEEGSKEAAKIGQGAAERLKEQGGPVGKLLGKAAGGGGDSSKKTRRLPIQRWTDVAVPVATAYEAWIDFEKYPEFMHRVLNVEKNGRDTVSWQEKIWFSKRDWEGQITERRKNDRIAWKTTKGVSHKGVVSFHKLDTNLTRVMVTLDFNPSGMVEKMASGLRFVKRAVQADLARFKAYVEMEDVRGLEYDAQSKNGGANGTEGRDDDDSDDEQSSS